MGDESKRWLDCDRVVSAPADRANHAHGACVCCVHTVHVLRSISYDGPHTAVPLVILSQKRLFTPTDRRSGRVSHHVDTHAAIIVHGMNHSAILPPEQRNSEWSCPPDSVFAANCNVIEKHGLGLFAASSIKAGELILLERPFVLTPAFESRHSVCALCFAQSTSWSLRCDQCDCVAFCSEACAQAQSQLHTELECAALRAWRRRREGLPEVDDGNDDEEAEDGGGGGDDDDDNDDDVADLVFQAIRILSYRHANRSSHSFVDSVHEDAQQLSVSNRSYAARLIGMR